MSSNPVIRILDRSTPPHVLTLIFLAGITALNTSIFLPSLNKMAEDFDTSYATIQLSVSGFLAATAIIQLAVGPLSDKFGRRKTMIVALWIFLAATILAATRSIRF